MTKNEQKFNYRSLVKFNFNKIVYFLQKFNILKLIEISFQINYHFKLIEIKIKYKGYITKYVFVNILDANINV